jgi:hypothetical protein
MEPELAQRLTEFCARTTRARATVIRAVLQLFLGSGEEGFRAADRTLSAGVWGEGLPGQPAGQKSLPHAPDDVARHVVDGQPLAASRRKRRLG